MRGGGWSACPQIASLSSSSPRCCPPALLLHSHRPAAKSQLSRTGPGPQRARLTRSREPRAWKRAAPRSFVASLCRSCLSADWLSACRSVRRSRGVGAEWAAARADPAALAPTLGPAHHGPEAFCSQSPVLSSLGGKPRARLSRSRRWNASARYKRCSRRRRPMGRWLRRPAAAGRSGGTRTQMLTRSCAVCSRVRMQLIPFVHVSLQRLLRSTPATRAQLAAVQPSFQALAGWRESLRLS